jgi:molybdopterin/thiamine biosynthesis adenylyltransferase
MAHILQVGAGSGGMPVLDLICRNPRIAQLTLIEPDVYKPHNVERHFFPASDAGKLKADLARDWLEGRCPQVRVEILKCDLLDPQKLQQIEAAARGCDVGVCAADNEAAKFHFDGLMRKAGKPWTLGEVLSGGIGGFVHWFRPGGPCYGCVASHLQRPTNADYVAVERPKAPDYSQPGGPVEVTTIPASKASIQTIASLHALVTLGLLDNPGSYDPGFTSLLLTLQRVPEVFEEPYRPYRFRVPRSSNCFVCGVETHPTSQTAQELDVALDQALARLAHE